MTKQVTKYAPDTMEHIDKSDLVQMSRDLLGAMVSSTKMMDESRKITPERLQEAKMVLGYLNATISATKTKLAYFKVVGIAEKVAAVKKMSSMVK